MAYCNVILVQVIEILKLIKELYQKFVYAMLYKQLIGSLRYICNSKPDINYGVGLVSRFMTNPITPLLIGNKTYP